MILTGGMVMDEAFGLRPWDVQILEGKIIRLGEHLEGDIQVDMTGRYILPGFIDSHIHGANGTRTNDLEPDISRITRFEVTQGVTSIALTTGASEFSDLLRQFDDIVDAAKRREGTKIAAIHAEGPFISQERKGAMRAECMLAPDTKKLDMLIERGRGLLRLMTVAPECDNAIQLIRHAVAKGITTSMGHTNATFEQAEKAIRAGATQATHTFNAMRSLHHREPGILGAVLTNPDICCEMICDHVHIHPAVIKLIYLAKGADHINIISDSGPAAGLPLKEFAVDGVKRIVKDGVVTLEDGTIAGSTKTVYDGVKNLLASGIPLSAVSKMASLNPAKSLKLDQEIGSIAVGKMADLVVLDQDYQIECTYVDGECAYKKRI